MAATVGRCAVLLMGPTGSGKSDLAIRLAQELPLEIVSVDSAQVFRGMDIGTAKASAEVRRAIPHHLIDIKDAAAGYSVGEFVRDAELAMQAIWRRGASPLLVGGTMLYFHALSAGLAVLPEADFGVREVIDAAAAAHGWPAMHRELAAVDPAAAARIHVNDPQRIQRALEVYRITGQPISALQRARVSAFADVKLLEFALAPLERAELHTHIEKRFQKMLEANLVAEVKHFYDRGDLTPEHPSMRAVGYRQLWRYLAGQATLSEAADRAIAATRQLAKRQLSWLRRREKARWLDAMHSDAARVIFDALSESGCAVRRSM